LLVIPKTSDILAERLRFAELHMQSNFPDLQFGYFAVFSAVVLIDDLGGFVHVVS